MISSAVFLQNSCSSLTISPAIFFCSLVLVHSPSSVGRDSVGEDFVNSVFFFGRDSGGSSFKISLVGVDLFIKDFLRDGGGCGDGGSGVGFCIEGFNLYIFFALFATVAGINLIKQKFESVHS